MRPARLVNSAERSQPLLHDAAICRQRDDHPVTDSIQRYRRGEEMIFRSRCHPDEIHDNFKDKENSHINISKSYPYHSLAVKDNKNVPYKYGLVCLLFQLSLQLFVSKRLSPPSSEFWQASKKSNIRMTSICFFPIHSSPLLPYVLQLQLVFFSSCTCSSPICSSERASA